MADIDKIKANDNVYNIKDSTARGYADDALMAAAEAKEAAEAASTTAEAAQSAARAAADAAEAAEGMANEAFSSADRAIDEAEAAQNAAEAALAEAADLRKLVEDLEERVAELEDAGKYSYYFAIVSNDGNQLLFYGADSLPTVGSQFGSVTVGEVYSDIRDTGTSMPPWYGYGETIHSVTIDESFSDFRPLSLYAWFYGLTSITGFGSKGLNHLDTCRATNMAWMFGNVPHVQSLDVDGFDTSRVTDMSCMFYGSTALLRINSNDDNFVTDAVTEDAGMFYGCTALVGGNGTAYDSSHVDSGYAHVDAAGNPGYFTAA